MAKKVIKDSIRARLRAGFISLAIFPLLLSGFILVWQSYTVQIDQSFLLQRAISGRALDRIMGYFHGVEDELTMATRVNNILGLSNGRQIGILSQVRSSYNTYHGDVYNELILLDNIGRVRARVSRTRVNTDKDLGEMSAADEFRLPVTSGKIYYSPVFLDNTNGEPVMTMGLPLIEARDGLPKGVLVAEIRLKDIWNLVADLRIGSRGSAYILNQTGEIIAHSNPSMVLKGTFVSVPEQTGIHKGLSGTRALIDRREIELGNQKLFLVTERPISEALSLTVRIVALIGVLLVVAVAGLLSLGLLVGRQIIQPIEALANTAQTISKGDLTCRAERTAGGEIDILADSFNTMTTRLVGTINSLTAEIGERRKTEALLRQAITKAEDEKAKSEAIVASIGDALSIQDTDFKVVYQNQVSKDWMGSHVGENCYKAYGQRERICEECFLAFAFIDGKTHRGERRVLTDNGPLDMEITASPLKDASGHIIGGIEIGRDVTERKNAEKDLLRERDLFKTLMESLPGFFYMITDRGKLLRWNKNVERVLGYSSEEIAERNAVDFFVERDKTLVAEKIEEVFMKGKSSVEAHLLAKDGREMPYLLTGLRYEMEDAPCLMGVALDISELKTAEEALRESHERLVAVLDGIDASVYVVDMETYEILFANRLTRDMFGDVVGRFCWEVFRSGQQCPCDFCTDRQLVDADGGAPAVCVREFQSPITGRWHLLHARAIRWVDGSMVRLEIVTDITDGKEAENKIKASLVEKEMLLREIHHRVKNNMQVISSLLEIQAGHIKDKLVSEMFSESRDRIRTMALIHEKLYASADMGRIDFGEYIRDLTDYIYQLYVTDPGAIGQSVNVNATPVNINTAVPLALIVNELFTNALKHAFPQGRKGEVRVGLSSDEDEKFTLIITDNGIGLPPEVEPGNAGTLGMQLVNTLVSQLKGEMEIDRSSGTEFKISFRQIERTKRR